MADNSARIAQIEKILRAGVTSAQIDGRSVTYDFAQLRAELRNLRATDDDATQRARRPVVSRIRLG